MIAELVEQFHSKQKRVICPFCSPERKKKNLKDLSLTRLNDGAVGYFCHHCSASGTVQPKERKLSAVPKATVINNGLTDIHYAWLSSRGISKQTADKMKLFSAAKWFNRLNANAAAIGFPYYRDGNLVAVKYRSIEGKDFTQDSGGAHDFFGIDHIIPGKPIIIVEGEMDCLSGIEAGLENVVSVPGGAPQKVSDNIDPSQDKAFAYVYNAKEILEQAPLIILATDMDEPGKALAESLAKRIGKDKCRIADLPKKDLNEMLMDDDFANDDPSRTIRDVIANAKSYPMGGIANTSNFFDRLNELYDKGTGSGFSTGYPSVDPIYTVAPGQLTVVTGYPSSGKSNFVDQMMVNLAKNEGWKFAVCSFENQTDIHITRLMELYTCKRFFDGQQRMSQLEMDNAFKWVCDHFMFMDTSADEPNTIDSILSRAKYAISQMGIKGMVIDPYNYIEHVKKDTTETEAISNILTQVQKFCKSTNTHIWFVAHPSKINRTGVEQPRPDGMSISGSMAWWAKTDNGITIHRRDGYVEMAVWKCRYRWVGTQGETTLLYDKASGSYRENDDKF
jgi:twinkle protein